MQDNESMYPTDKNITPPAVDTGITIPKDYKKHLPHTLETVVKNMNK